MCAAGTAKWLGNTIAQKKAIKAQPKLKPMSDAELEGVVGGAKDPKWRPEAFVSEAPKTKFIDTKTAAEMVANKFNAAVKMCKGNGHKMDVMVNRKPNI